MEYLEGGSLSEAAKKYDFEEDHIAFIGREMLKAISYLHNNKLVFFFCFNVFLFFRFFFLENVF